MVDVFIEKFVSDIGISVDWLVSQFSDVGIKKVVGENVIEDEKCKLLDYLSKQYGGINGGEFKKMML